MGWYNQSPSAALSPHTQEKEEPDSLVGDVCVCSCCGKPLMIVCPDNCRDATVKYRAGRSLPRSVRGPRNRLTPEQRAEIFAQIRARGRTEKPCANCKEVKPVEAFHPMFVKGTRVPQLTSKCIECTRVRSSEYNAAKKGRNA
jgi:hypothetical protein